MKSWGQTSERKEEWRKVKNSRELQDIKNGPAYTWEFQKKKRETAHRITEEVIVEKLPYLIKNINVNIQEAWRNRNRINVRTLNHERQRE